MGYAFITTNVVDMRSEPSNRSERVNQVLFGETVKTRRRKDGFWLIEQRDGYAGWVNERFLANSHKEHFDRGLNHVVYAKSAQISNPRGGSIEPYFVYYGTELVGRKVRNGIIRATLPDGSLVDIKASAVRPIMKEKNFPASMLLSDARRFLGVPYLWGGITPAGFDCSGFTRAVFGRFGIRLARDTKDQVKQGEPIDRASIRGGDLIFFPGHVGIAIGRNRLIHATRGGGGVRINSLSPGAEDYRDDLDQSYTEARRILGCI